MIMAFLKYGSDSFSLEDYIKSIGRENELQGVGTISHLRDLEPQLNTQLKDIETALITNAQSVLQGNYWPKVAMDWGDYK